MKEKISSDKNLAFALRAFAHPARLNILRIIAQKCGGVGSMAGVPGTGAKRPTAARKNETNGDKNNGGGVGVESEANNGDKNNGGGVGVESEANNGDKRESNTCCCADVTKSINLAQSTISQHIKVLLEAGLIKRKSEGTKNCYTICLERLDEMQADFDAYLKTQIKANIAKKAKQ